jgi:hypothetical protein
MLLSQQHAARCLQSVGQQQTSMQMAVTDLATSAALHGRGSASTTRVSAAHAQQQQQQQQQHRISGQAAMAAAVAGAGPSSSRASSGAGAAAAEAERQPPWLPSSGKWEKWPGEKATLAGMLCAWQAAAVLSGGPAPCSGVSTASVHLCAQAVPSTCELTCTAAVLHAAWLRCVLQTYRGSSSWCRSGRAGSTWPSTTC